MKSVFSFYLLVTVLSLSFSLQSMANETGKPNLSLNDCIKMGLENNKIIKSSELEHEQSFLTYDRAKSGYWPRLDINTIFSVMDTDPHILYPAETSTYKISGVPIPNMPEDTKLNLTVDIPEKKVMLRDKVNMSTDLILAMPLYTGGEISGYIDQARINTEVKEYAVNLTKGEIVYNIKKIYYSMVHINKLKDMISKMVTRYQVLTDITYSRYNGSSMNTNRTDYLKVSMMTEMMKSMEMEINSKYKNTESKLKFMTGIDLSKEFTIDEMEYKSDSPELAGIGFAGILEANDYKLMMIDKGIQAKNHEKDIAFSNYLPKFFAFGRYMNILNSYDYGQTPSAMKNNWVVGVGMNFSIFNGFETSSKVQYADKDIELMKMNKEIYLDKKLTDLQSLSEEIDIAKQKLETMKNAKEMSKENYELTDEAYKADIMDFKAVQESLMMDALLQYNYMNSEYELTMKILEFEKELGMIKD